MAQVVVVCVPAGIPAGLSCSSVQHSLCDAYDIFGIHQLTVQVYAIATGPANGSRDSLPPPGGLDTYAPGTICITRVTKKMATSPVRGDGGGTTILNGIRRSGTEPFGQHVYHAAHC